MHSNRHGLELAAGDAAFGSFKWSGRLEVSFASDVRDRLIAERVVDCSPDEPCEDRISLVVRHVEDVDRAIWLLRLAYVSLVDESMLERAVGVSGIDHQGAVSPVWTRHPVHSCGGLL
jgi:hypothetical protein